MKESELIQITKEAKGIKLDITVLPTEEGLTVTVYGGDKPHVGAVAIGLPRPSLADPSKTSATASVFALVGHKDDEIAKPVAEMLAAKLRKPIVVVAGVHLVSPSTEQINTVMELIPKVSEEILQHFPS